MNIITIFVIIEVDRPLSGRRGRRGCVVRAEQSNGVSGPLPPPGNTGAAPSPVSRLTHDSGIGLSLIPTGAPYPLTGRFFLTQRRPNRVHVQRIDRRAAGHEQPIALRAAEAKIGNDFRRMEERHLFAVWCMDAHAVRLDAAPAPAAPDVAVGIAADAVREPPPG